MSSGQTEIRGGYGHDKPSSNGYDTASANTNIRGGYGYQSGGFDIPMAEPVISGGYGHNAAPSDDRYARDQSSRTGSSRHSNRSDTQRRDQV